MKVFRINIHFTDGTGEEMLSEYPPKFSENFICIAPFREDTDVFFNIATIRKIIVHPDR
jgi:hypothetical protein